MANQSFSRQKRLLESEHFKHVFDLPDKRLSTKYVLLLACKNKLQHSRIGFVISKKNVKLAVQRNRVRRQIREIFRLNQHLLDNYDIVIVARRGFNEIPNNELREQFHIFWKKLFSCKVIKPEVNESNA